MTIREQVAQIAETMSLTSNQALEHSLLETLPEDDLRILEEFSRVAFLCSESLKEALNAV